MPLLLNSVDPEKWYSVREAAVILGWGEDSVRRWIQRGLLIVFILPHKPRRGYSIHRFVRIQGRELIRFVQNHLNQN